MYIHRMTVGIALLCAACPFQRLAAQSRIELSTDEEKGLYALGLTLAEITNRFRLSPKELEFVSAGLHDGVLKHPALELNDFRQKVLRMGDLRGFQTEREELKLGHAFQEDVLRDPHAIRHASGMISIVQQEGAGDVPTASSKIKITFVGSLRDGTEFDRTRSPLTVPASSAPFACLKEAITTMKVGERVRVVCPPELTAGFIHPLVPPGATLVFDLKLLEIVGSTSATTPSK